MAIATLADYKLEIAGIRELLSINLTTLTTVAGRPYDCWVPAAPAGVAPTTAVVPTNATVGALGQSNPSSGQLSILAARFSSLNPGLYLIADRLSHQGGLSGTTTGAQTTNLPTSALTRYTTGDGVMAGLSIYTQVGSTGTTATMSYTNQAGTSSRTSTAVAFGGTGFREASRLILMPLQAGDTGVRAVASVTLAASTLTAGAFGVTLFKPLYALHVVDASGVLPSAGFISGFTGGGVPAIADNGCLFAICISQGLNSMGCGALITSEN